MVMLIWEIGKTTKLKEKECIYIQMEHSILAHGAKINKMVLGKKFGQIIQNMLALIMKEKNMDMGILFEQMVLVILENLKITILKDKGFIHG